MTPLWTLIAVLSTLALASERVALQPDQMKWKDAAAPMPAGAKVALLEGDPKSDGIFTMRLRIPAAYRLEPHTHPGDERVTVLEGEVFVGLGDVIDEKRATRFGPGGYYVNPAGVSHFIWAGKRGAVIQVTTQGPWGITFLSGK